jgi:hypothetical protein
VSDVSGILGYHRENAVWHPLSLDKSFPENLVDGGLNPGGQDGFSVQLNSCAVPKDCKAITGRILAIC